MAGATPEIVRAVVRLRVEREEPGGAHVDEDDGASGVRAHRALDRLLELGVDREPKVTAGERLLAGRGVEEALRCGPGPVTSARVDDALLPSALPAEVALPGALDACRADDVADVV